MEVKVASAHISTATTEITGPFNFISYNQTKSNKSTAKCFVLEYCFIIILSAKYCVTKRPYQKASYHVYNKNNIRRDLPVVFRCNATTLTPSES